MDDVDLDRRPVLLLASFPSGERGEQFKPFEPDEIGDAVSELVRALFTANATLVLGGHPTITPLVVRIAREHDAKDRVVVYQSEFFRRDITPATWEIVEAGYGRIEWTEATGDDRTASLRRMRELMVERSEAVAALFVGGMEGIREEYDLIGDHRPTASRLPIGGPGGAARQLEPVGPAGEPVTSDVRKQLASHHYPLVAAIVVRHIAELR